MAADVVVYGAVTVPRSGREEWLTSEIRGEHYAWMSEIGRDACACFTPEVLMESLKEVACEAHERLELTWLSSTLSIEASLSFERYLEVGQSLAHLAVSALSANGFGALTVLGQQPMRFGFRVAVGRGGVTFQQLSVDLRLQAEESPQFAKTVVQTAAQLDRLVGRRRPALGVNPFTGHAA